MARYVSAQVWQDLTDGHLYREGDVFPFDGREISAERLAALESGRNRAGLRLIRADGAKDEQAEAPKKEAPKKASESRKTAAKKPAEKKPATRKTTK